MSFDIYNLYFLRGSSTVNPSYGVQGSPRFPNRQVVKASNVDNTEAWPDVVVERLASMKEAWRSMD